MWLWIIQTAKGNMDQERLLQRTRDGTFLAPTLSDMMTKVSPSTAHPPCPPALECGEEETTSGFRSQQSRVPGTHSRVQKWGFHINK